MTSRTTLAKLVQERHSKIKTGPHCIISTLGPEVRADFQVLLDDPLATDNMRSELIRELHPGAPPLSLNLILRHRRKMCMTCRRG